MPEPWRSRNDSRDSISTERIASGRGAPVGRGLARAAARPGLQPDGGREARRARLSPPSPPSRLRGWSLRARHRGPPHRGALPWRPWRGTEPHDGRVVVAPSRMRRPRVVHIVTPASSGRSWGRQVPPAAVRSSAIIERRLPVDARGSHPPGPRRRSSTSGCSGALSPRPTTASSSTPAAVERECGRGRRGSTALRRALALHLPELARARNDFEREFLLLVERRRPCRSPRSTPPSRASRSTRSGATRVSIVELDGHETHANPVANEEDRRRELDPPPRRLPRDLPLHVAARSPREPRRPSLSRPPSARSARPPARRGSGSS